MPDVPAVSTPPTVAIPEIAGLPVAGVLVALEPVSISRTVRVSPPP